MTSLEMTVWVGTITHLVHLEPEMLMHTLWLPNKMKLCLHILLLPGGASIIAVRTTTLQNAVPLHQALDHHQEA